MTAAQSLLGADRSVIGVPNGTDMWTAASDTAGTTALDDYLGYYNQVDFVLRHRRQELGLEVYHRDMLYRPGELGHDELHNDWCIPHRLYDTLGMGVELSPGSELPACIHFYHERATGPEFGEKGVELLQLLLPAFKAGVHTHCRLAQHRAGLLRLIDTLDMGLEIFDRCGESLHQNSALGTLLSLESDPSVLSHHIAQIAAGLSRSLRCDSKMPAKLPEAFYREVRTGTASYRLMGTVLGEALLGPEVTIAVCVVRLTPEPISDAALAARYRLTPRELQVVRLLGQGDSSADIARLLGISRYTARHHAENVMRKLDVRSRAAVAARLVASR